MDDLEQFKQTYFQECEELLGDLEAQLMALEDGDRDVDVLHAAFRAIHSIKGGAGAFGFDQLVSFAHTFETVLDLMREEKVELTDDNVSTSVRAGDILADLVNAAQSGDQLPADHGADVLQALSVIAGGEAGAPAAESGDEEDDGDLDDLDFTPVRIDLEDGAAPPADADAGDAAAPDGPEPELDDVGAPAVYRVTFRPRTEMLQRANEPLLLVRELKELGTLTATADISDLPPLPALQHDAAYLSWTFELVTTQDLMAIEDVFEFVTDDCDLSIEMVEDTSTPDADDAAASPAPAGADEAAEPAAPKQTTADAEAGETSDAAAKPAAGDGEAAKADAPKPADKTPEKKDKAKSQAAAPAVSAIRVDLDKVDRLVNMVGELVITQAMISQQSDQVLADRYPDLVRGLEQLFQHTRGLQDSVMAIRAQPVKSVFSRMPRLVRELSMQIGKKIRLEMSGENTEIDKTVIEQLNDPLTHMIRNACDHGIEDPEKRAAAGKPAEGTILLSAEQRGGRIVIQIVDDGQGVNRERVFAKAVEKGLIAADANLTDEEIDNLIFSPGFSTAETVSNISGRGVGMDVVRQNIQKLGGRVSVRSEPGKGSNIILTLPLTLAVLDGMIVRVGGESYVIPLTNVIESLSPQDGDISMVAGGGDVISIRGEYIELIYLNQVFSIDAVNGAQSNGLVVLVEVEGGGKVGLVVDEILGQQQVVIKSLEENFDPIPGIGGATILGDGNVALILDVTGVRSLQVQASAASAAEKTAAIQIEECVA